MTPTTAVLCIIADRLRSQGAWEELRHLERMSIDELDLIVALELEAQNTRLVAA